MLGKPTYYYTLDIANYIYTVCVCVCTAAVGALVSPLIDPVGGRERQVSSIPGAI